MNWFGTVTLRVGCKIACPIAEPERCWVGEHHFSVEESTPTPVSPDVEKAIREKLQAQLDLIVEKFMEAHK